MNVRYRITLTQYERNELGALLSGGKSPARKLKRAQILLAADAGVSDEDIALSVGVGGGTAHPDNAALRRRQPEARAERRAASWCGAQAHRQGGSSAGGDRVLEPAGGPRPLGGGTGGGAGGH